MDIAYEIKKLIIEAVLREGRYEKLKKLLDAGGREIAGDLFCEYLEDTMRYQRKVNELRSKMLHILDEKERVKESEDLILHPFRMRTVEMSKKELKKLFPGRKEVKK